MGNEKHKKSVEDELESVAPHLAKLKRHSLPVDIPEGYFDQLSDDVFRRIRKEEAARHSAGPSLWVQWWAFLSGWFQRPAYALALASVTVLLVSIAIFNSGGQPADTLELSMTEEDINDYIDYYIDEFDFRLLAEETPDSPEITPFSIQEDSLVEEELDEYFDELLDEMDLEEFL